MTPRTLLLALTPLALLSGCHEEVVSGVAEDAGSVAQFEGTGYGHTASAIWAVLVVDDAPTAAARSLRERLAEDVRGFFDDLDDADCGMNADPAAYRPIDQRLIVVGASGTLEPRFRDEDGLHIASIDAAPDLLLAYEEASGAAIVGMETSEVLPFIGVAELAHYVNLIEGSEPPRSPAEEELIAARPARFYPWAALARTRPDVSPEHSGVSSTRSMWGLNLLYWPDEGDCPVITDWQTSVPTLEPLEAQWTSPSCFVEARIFEPGLVADCRPRCMPRSPAIDASGQASCRVYGEFPLHETCEENPGWTFLDATTSQFSGYESQQVNLCELRQAQGDALDACINDFACEGCEPSFCFRRLFTEDDENDPAHRRPTGAADSRYCGAPGTAETSSVRLRIVHGADQINGPIRIVCQR